MGIEMFSLEGKTALVTGASRGIGAAIALAYAECGADVALAARSTGDLETLAGKIEATGRKAIPITCDVTNIDDIESCVSQALDGLGKIDVLVNNAGGTKFMSPVVDLRPDGWTQAITLNLDNVFHFSRLVGKHMLERRAGSVVNMASVAGLGSTPALSYYGAAKAAVVSLTKTLAAEWGHANVRANAICPGWIKTDLNRIFWSNEESAKAMISGVPYQRWGETNEIVGAAIWLASDAASYVTGSTIVIDGGLTA